MQPSPMAGTSGPFFPSLRVSMRLLSSALLAEPVPRAQEVPVEFLLRARRFRLPVVAPFHDRRQRHQYGLRAPARLQPEQRAAIIDEIEFDVTSAAVRLKIALAIAVWKIPAALQQRQICGQQVIADAAHQSEASIEAAVVQVVEEDPADAARLAAMLEIEVLVAPALEAGIEIRSEGFERAPALRVEVARVLLEAVVGGEVHAAAEPPHRIASRLGRDEKAHVHVHGRHEGVARVQHQRHAHCLEAAAREVRARRARGRGQLPAFHAREIHPAALEYASLLDDPAFAPSAFATLPAIQTERPTVDAFKLRNDAVLESDEVVTYGDRVHLLAATARNPMSWRYCMPSKRTRSTAS